MKALVRLILCSESVVWGFCGGTVCNETHDKTHYKECSLIIRLFIQP